MNRYYVKVDTHMIFRSILSGMFIGLGCIFMLVVKSDTNLSKSISALLSGLVFSIGLYLVLCFSSNLFTGSCINFKNVLAKQMTMFDFIKLLGINYIFNFIGIAIMAYCGHHIGFCSVSESIAYVKFSKPNDILFVDGFLCNVLVCLAVFLRNKNVDSSSNTLISVLFTVTMFVACGFEHSIADMFFLFFINHNIISIVYAIATLIFISFANLLGGLFISTLFYYADL